LIVPTESLFVGVRDLIHMKLYILDRENVFAAGWGIGLAGEDCGAIPDNY